MCVAGGLYEARLRKRNAAPKGGVHNEPTLKLAIGSANRMLNRVTADSQSIMGRVAIVG